MDYQIISKALIANIFGISRAAVTQACRRNDYSVMDYTKIKILEFIMNEKDIDTGRKKMISKFKKEYKRRGEQDRIQGRPLENYNIKDGIAIIEEVYSTIKKHS
jgi:predicted DNA-binding protein YlxM (UPF0122 family)